MKKSKRFIMIILFFLVFIMLCLCYGSIINKEKRKTLLKIGFYDDYPHFYINNKANVCGYYKDITENLAKKLNFKEDEVMIFGDQKNDISMFDVSGFYKVAMGNAVPEIKKRANYVTKTNNEDGIAYALRRLIFDE